MIPSRDILMDELLLQVDAMMSLRRRAFCARPPHRDVSLPQVHILMTLQEDGAMTVSGLAHLLNVSAPSASALIDRLEEREFVRRWRDSEDRRVVHVSITDRGRALLDELMGMGRERARNLFVEMTDEELLATRRGFEAIRRAIDRMSMDRVDDQAATG